MLKENYEENVILKIYIYIYIYIFLFYKSVTKIGHIGDQ